MIKLPSVRKDLPWPMKGSPGSSETLLVVPKATSHEYIDHTGMTEARVRENEMTQPIRNIYSQTCFSDHLSTKATFFCLPWKWFLIEACTKGTCSQRPPVYKDHFLWFHRAVAIDRFDCIYIRGEVSVKSERWYEICVKQTNIWLEKRFNCLKSSL